MARGVDDEDLLLQAVRGELDMVDAVSQLGIEVEQRPGAVIWEIPADSPVVTPSVRDVARGLLSLCARGGLHLQTWARYVLAINTIDLVKLEDDGDGQVILNGVWDAAGGDGVDGIALDAARRVAG